MTDVVQGMEYLHSTSLKAHRRLKLTQCIVTCRWVLNITDFAAASFRTKLGDVCAFAIIMHEVFYQTKPFGLEDILVEEILKRVIGRAKPPFRPQVIPSCHYKLPPN
ncbi:Atrial natriuretic peptide receptor [Echinococcus granulosus]|uniref:guanylate cyclase n=1 Tax=Echinococcus granulosus TaxID=6210 RepID=W6UKM7_ECHGR|nr:Atrial natriuretic peptide receptor [Echinococcus granulosus]EUB54044.1 Atrial natriuretic peptide receptor [Echinococcus granulosus]